MAALLGHKPCSARNAISCCPAMGPLRVWGLQASPLPACRCTALAPRVGSPSHLEIRGCPWTLFCPNILRSAQWTLSCCYPNAACLSLPAAACPV